MMPTEAFPTIPLPITMPQTWPATRVVGTIVVDERLSFPFVPSSNLWFSVVSVGDVRASLADRVIFKGPSEFLVSNAGFALAAAAKLIEYQRLPDNWDGEGATAPSLEAVGNALRMLAAVPSHLEAPKPMILASGEVALYWVDGDTYAEIGFDETSYYYAYATRPGFEPVHLNDEPIEDDAGHTVFPMDVLELLPSDPFKAAA